VLLFALIVSGIYLGMNWYVLARLARLFALRRRRWLFCALVPLSASLVAALALESAVGNRLTGIFYTLAMLWLGACWLLLCLLVAQQVLSQVLPLPRRVWAIGVCGLAAGLTLYASVNARTVTIRREQIPGLPLRVVHLSDIHIGSIGRSTLAEVVAATNALQPEAILITGDLFDNANSTTRALAALLSGFAAPVLFSSGNHEGYTGYDNVRQMLTGTSVRWLRNESIEFKGIQVIGVENSYGTELLRSVLDRTRTSAAFTILMNHQPRGFDIAASRRIGLMLCGHVHNGQIWPFNYLVGVFFPHLRDLHSRERSFLNVSTGTGYWGPPMRLGSSNEIVVLEPTAKARAIQ
jgi:predicted MPP superfamily phosphohydrolase